MHTPEEPSDIDEKFSRRQVIAGLGLTSIGAGGFGYRQGLMEDYDELSIHNIGSDQSKLLKYSLEGEDRYIELQEVEDNFTSETATLAIYENEFSADGFMETESVNSGSKIDNSILSSPDVIVSSVNYREEGDGRVDFKVKSELNPEILEP